MADAADRKSAVCHHGSYDFTASLAQTDAKRKAMAIDIATAAMPHAD